VDLGLLLFCVHRLSEKKNARPEPGVASSLPPLEAATDFVANGP